MKCNMGSVEAEWVGTWNSKLYCWSTTSVQNFKLDWRNLLNMLAKDLTEGKTSLQLDLIRLNRRCLSLTSLSLPPPPLPFSFKIPSSLNRKKNQHNKEHMQDNFWKKSLCIRKFVFMNWSSISVLNIKNKALL